MTKLSLILGTLMIVVFTLIAWFAGHHNPYGK